MNFFPFFLISLHTMCVCRLSIESDPPPPPSRTSQAFLKEGEKRCKKRRWDQSQAFIGTLRTAARGPSSALRNATFGDFSYVSYQLIFFGGGGCRNLRPSAAVTPNTMTSGSAAHREAGALEPFLNGKVCVPQTCCFLFLSMCVTEGLFSSVLLMCFMSLGRWLLLPSVFDGPDGTKPFIPQSILIDSTP